MTVSFEEKNKDRWIENAKSAKILKKRLKRELNNQSFKNIHSFNVNLIDLPNFKYGLLLDITFTERYLPLNHYDIVDDFVALFSKNFNISIIMKVYEGFKFVDRISYTPNAELLGHKFKNYF